MSRYVCPDCYRELEHAPKRGRDARCQSCRDDLPVNGRWARRGDEASLDGFIPRV